MGRGLRLLAGTHLFLMALYCLENLIDDFRVQRLTRMERDDNLLLFSHIDSVTTPASFQPKPGLQKQIVCFQRCQAGQFRQLVPL